MSKLSKILIFKLLTVSIFVQAQDATSPNIIFIVTDDLNDYINNLEGLPSVSTPNIDRISSKGTVFTNAVCSAPLCCPSRTSFLTGKDPGYTHIYSAANYKCSDFAKNFTAEGNNETYFTLPGYLKDSANYFTYGINKIFHCYENFQEYDDETINACDKSLSWNKIFVYNDSSIINSIIIEEGVQNNEWSKINDTLEPYLMDYVAIDSSIDFIAKFANGEGTCGNPFFLALGIKKPHKPLYIPEKYFLDEYISDFYTTPFDIPFNYPVNSYPENGIILPPQPEVPFSDYYNLPTDGLGQQMVKTADDNFIEWAEDLSPMPIINSDFSDSLTLDILAWSKRANCVMAYLAGVKYIDAQIGRLLDSLEAYPEVYNNTIIVFIGDNGYSLGEKRHWGKRALWETDVRIPLLISDFRNPLPNISSSMVSLLDIFPTICALANIPFPTFADGSPYLDGNVITDLMANPAIIIERPQLSSVKKETDTEGSCYPQYSVRNDEFHYIRYQSNGGGLSDCDSSNSYYEEELYQIGIQRNIDPNEWNNLVSNNDYKPVINYLSQWLPDSSMYLQTAFKINIVDSFSQCLFSYDDSIKLSFNLFDTLGTEIAITSGYKYRWTNNLSADTLNTATATLPLNFINPSVFNESNELIVYAQMIDTLTNKIVGFDLKTIKINTNNEPVINYTPYLAGELTIGLIDVVITGDYDQIEWDFGDGYIFEGEYPEPHTYDSANVYEITCEAMYGNNENCSIISKQSVNLESISFETTSPLVIYPNPATSSINVFIGFYDQSSNLIIHDATGKAVFRKHLNITDYPLITIPVDKLSSGIYYITVQTANSLLFNNFVVIGNK